MIMMKTTKSKTNFKCHVFLFEETSEQLIQLFSGVNILLIAMISLITKTTESSDVHLTVFVGMFSVKVNAVYKNHFL